MNSLAFTIVLLTLASPALAKSSYSAHPGAPVFVLDREPDRLGFGDTILVNDGSCPTGQIKQVTGGNRNKGVARARECVAH